MGGNWSDRAAAAAVGRARGALCRTATVAVIVASLALVPYPGLATAASANLASMYNGAAVAQVQPRRSSRVAEIFERAFVPNLLPVEQRALANVRLESPIDGDPLLGYYSHSRNKVDDVSDFAAVLRRPERSSASAGDAV